MSLYENKLKFATFCDVKQKTQVQTPQECSVSLYENRLEFATFCDVKHSKLKSKLLKNVLQWWQIKFGGKFQIWQGTALYGGRSHKIKGVMS